MLVRKYIHQRLKEYYAQPFDRVVGSIHQPQTSSTANTNIHNYKVTANSTTISSLSSSSSKCKIPFRYLLGEYHWNYIYGKLYRQTSGQWLTPSELFSPYYGQCMALWMIQQIEQRKQHIIQRDSHNKSSRNQKIQHDAVTMTSAPSNTLSTRKVAIEIVELGGGRGTNAIDILDYIYKHHYETIYTNIVSYTVLDSSEPLLQHQNVAITEHDRNNNTSHAKVFQNRYFDLYNYATMMTAQQQPISNNAPVQTEDNESIVVFRKPPPPPPQAAVTSSTSKVVYTEEAEEEEIITIVIGLEILDNLPHDKIRVTNSKQRTLRHRTSSNTFADLVVEQAELQRETVTSSSSLSSMPDLPVDTNFNDSGQYEHQYEVYVPLTDSLVQHVLQYYPLPVSGQQVEQYYWIPTIACGLIYGLLKERPNALFLFADFDSFANSPPKATNPSKYISTAPVNLGNKNITPSNQLNPRYHYPPPAIGEPIVTDMNDIDLISYLDKADTATDILFPTNFHALATYIRSIHQEISSTKTTITTSMMNSNIGNVDTDHKNSQVVLVQKQYDFLKLHGPQQVQATTSYCFGYSPMIHDFENCSILTFGSSTSSEAIP
jgi:Putative S-adenosyl-L-methionine-dependent methyltransferase